MESTITERQKVARDECRVHGHTFEHILVMESLAPQSVICATCGSSWRIHPEDAAKNF